MAKRKDYSTINQQQGLLVVLDGGPNDDQKVWVDAQVPPPELFLPYVPDGAHVRLLDAIPRAVRYRRTARALTAASGVLPVYEYVGATHG